MMKYSTLMLILVNSFFDPFSSKLEEALGDKPTNNYRGYIYGFSAIYRSNVRTNINVHLHLHIFFYIMFMTPLKSRDLDRGMRS